MKKFLTLVSLCLGLAIGTALAESGFDKQVVKTELSSDVLSVPVFELEYIAEFSNEIVPEFVPAKTGEVSFGFKTQIYHPPTVAQNKDLPTIRKL